MADYLDKDGLSYFWEKIKAIFATKQDTLVSGTNIKTINNNSLLGSGNIDIQSGGGDVTDVEVNGVSVVDQDGVAEVIVPTKTSDLTNDSDFVSDASYVHTDNNFTTTLKNKLDGIEAGAEVNDVNDVEVDGTSVVSGGVASIDLTGKQDTLVSGTNIKTVNNYSLLGAGNINIQGGVASFPAGIISPFAGQTAPSGWLLCDGSAVSRTTYSALFDVIGTLYGAGDESTTFNLPDLRGRMPLGVGESSADGHTAHTIAEADGKEAYKLTGAQSGVQDHTHIYYDYDTTYSLPNGYRTATDHTKYALISATASRANHQRTTNGSGAKDATDNHTNMPPYLSVNFIIATGQ